LEERGCLFLKEKTSVLMDVETVFMSYVPFILINFNRKQKAWVSELAL
jgi:hypothetical protein